MRDLKEVLDAILLIVPQTEKGLIIDLNKVKDSLMFAAPESASMWWAEAADAFEANIGDTSDPSKLLDWQKAVMNIFTGQRVAALSNKIPPTNENELALKLLKKIFSKTQIVTRDTPRERIDVVNKKQYRWVNYLDVPVTIEDLAEVQKLIAE